VTALVEADGLVSRFVRAPLGVRPSDRATCTPSMASASRSKRQDRCAGRRIRLGQIDGRALVLRLIEPTAAACGSRAGRVCAERSGHARLPRQAQLVFQDPYASLNPRMTVGDILAEPLALHDIVPPAAEARACRAGDGPGRLEPRFAPRYPHEFSGGQRQRIVIRARTRGRTEADRVRRARLGARCLDPLRRCSTCCATCSSA